MACRHVDLGNGAHAIICGLPRQKRCKCGAPATKLCDWKMRAGGTCDAPICEACAIKPNPRKDICPDHRAAYDAWVARLKAPRRTT